MPSRHFLNILLSLIVVIGLVSLAFFLKSEKQSYITTEEQKQTLEDLNKNTKNIQPIDIIGADISTADLGNWNGKDTTDRILSQIEKTTPTINTEPKTLTEKLGRDLATQYLTAKSSGQALTEQQKQDLAQAVISKDYSSQFDFTYKDYTEKDLSVTNIVTSDEIIKYLNNLTKTFNNTKLKTQIDDLGIITRAFSTEDASEMNKLNPLINYYKNTSLALKNITVPKPLISLHLSIINSLKRAGDDLEYVKSNFNDPLVSLQAINNYQSSLKAYKSSLDLLATTFGGKNSQ